MVLQHQWVVPSQGRRVRIALRPDHIAVGRGMRARLRLRVENPAETSQDVALRSDDLPAGWSLSPKFHCLRLPPRSAALVILRLEVPPDAWEGERVAFRVTAHSSLHANRATHTGEALVAEVEP